jgi:hypothetical protein
MDHGPLSHLHLPPHLDELAGDDPRADALLTRWDELAPARRVELEAHPVLGPRLAQLRAAEDWLGRGLAARRAAEAARPAAEELFRYARGAADVDATPLTIERRRAIERHLAARPEEADWVAALQRRPPPPPLLTEVPPLVNGALGPVAAGDDEGEAPPLFGRRRTQGGGAPWWSRGLPLVAAAAVLAAGATLLREPPDAFATGAYDLLRGPLDEPLRFPRGRVLAAPTGARGLFANEPRYEFTAEPGAEAYRLTLRRHDGGAFGVGDVVWSSRSTEALEAWETQGAAVTVAGAPLPPGHFTWEVFALEDGLERSLGSLDFHVVDDGAALARLVHAPLAEQVERLVQSGFTTDARHRARLLPPGATRARFLQEDPTAAAAPPAPAQGAQDRAERSGER